MSERPNEALDYVEEIELMGLDRESERESIATRLNEVIYGRGGEFDLDNLQDIVGDGDLAEYL